MTTIDVVKELDELIASRLTLFDSYSKKRNIRESERAMILSGIECKVAALHIAREAVIKQRPNHTVKVEEP